MGRLSAYHGSCSSAMDAGMEEDVVGRKKVDG